MVFSLREGKRLDIVTHTWADADGYIGILKLKRQGADKIPGVENAKTVFWGGELDHFPKENVVFVDIRPNGVKADPKNKVFVFDHHPHSEWLGETSSSLIDKFLGLSDDKNLELTQWADRGDFKTGGDSTNIANVSKHMHLCYSDEEILDWFGMTVEAHFGTPERLDPEDLQKGWSFFSTIVENLLAKHKAASKSKAIFERWLQRGEKTLEDRMGIAYRTAANLAFFGPKKTEEWLLMGLQSIEESQRTFWKAEKDFERAEKILVGNRVIVIGESSNPKFNQFCRSTIAKEKMPRPLNAKEDPIVVQFQSENRGFQIFPNRSRFKLHDIAGALRVEILRARREWIPPDWRELKKDGSLSGTEPLYYHKGDFEVIMWGSLTTPAVRPMDISRELVRKIVLISADTGYFPDECKRSDECLQERCPFYPWRLGRCAWKRKQNRNSLFKN
ncbi:hypothetical protein KJA14_01350 [Patescibacteria group bacterium]|nr:hypothetical protein [Patescibacteria group bacterium]